MNLRIYALFAVIFAAAEYAAFPSFCQSAELPENQTSPAENSPTDISAGKEANALIIEREEQEDQTESPSVNLHPPLTSSATNPISLDGMSINLLLPKQEIKKEEQKEKPEKPQKKKEEKKNKKQEKKEKKTEIPRMKNMKHLSDIQFSHFSGRPVNIPHEACIPCLGEKPAIPYCQNPPCAQKPYLKKPTINNIPGRIKTYPFFPMYQKRKNSRQDNQQ